MFDKIVFIKLFFNLWALKTKESSMDALAKPQKQNNFNILLSTYYLVKMYNYTILNKAILESPISNLLCILIFSLS